MKRNFEFSPLVEIRRNGISEKILFGTIAWSTSAEDLSLVGGDYECYGRSLMKPFQMKAIVDHWSTLPPVHRALALASHNGTEQHISQVRAMLKDDPAELKLPASKPLGGHTTLSSKLHHPCSGKHAAIVGACDAKGWTRDYCCVEHPFNQSYLAHLRKLLGNEIGRTATDGCGLPTFSLRISQLARLYASLAVDQNKDDIWNTMRSHPNMIGGEGRLDTEIMRHCRNVVAKEGADGLLGISIDDPRFPDGLGIAVKLVHGYDMETMWHIAQRLLGELGYSLPVRPGPKDQEVYVPRFLSGGIWEEPSQTEESAV